MREHPNSILERESAGIRVDLAYLPTMDMLGVQVSVEDRMMWASVPKDKALDAFWHPMLYLSADQVKALLDPPREDEDMEIEDEDVPEAPVPFDQEDDDYDIAF